MAKIKQNSKTISSKVDGDELIARAFEARKNSHSPYTKYAVGAAVLTDKGCFGGTNIEHFHGNGGGACAEMVAIWKAVSEGARKVLAIAVYGAPAKAGEFITPCGRCLHVMSEFTEGKVPVFVSLDGKKALKSFRFEELLPHRYVNDALWKSAKENTKKK